MNRKIANSFWMVAVTVASLAMTACNKDGNETEKPFTTAPVESSILYACGINPDETKGVTEAANVVFTENDILWFNVNTRELKFKEMEEPLYKKLNPFHEIEIRLGDNALFVVSSFVGLWDSRLFDNLVLCYGKMEMDGEVSLDDNYYLYDCYPLQIINTDAVKANREKNAAQWETFTKYLESKGKLKK